VQMAETGGPIEEMDGTLDSLIPLWDWYQARVGAGLPEIPKGAMPSTATFFGWPASDTIEGRASYAFEPFAHYLLEILRKYDGDAHWVLSPSKTSRYIDFRSTVVSTPLQPKVPAEDVAQNLAMNLLTGRPNVAHARGMLDRVLLVTTLGDRASVIERGSSLLAPLLAAPRVGQQSAMRVSPRAQRESEHVGRDGRVSSGDFLLAMPHAGPDFLGPAIPPYRELAIGLAEMGIWVDGRPVAVDDLLLDGRQMFFGDLAVSIHPYIVGGQLTALSVQPIGIEEAEWLAFCDALENLAKRLGLLFGAPEHFG